MAGGAAPIFTALVSAVAAKKASDKPDVDSPDAIPTADDERLKKARRREELRNRSILGRSSTLISNGGNKGLGG